MPLQFSAEAFSKHRATGIQPAGACAGDLEANCRIDSGIKNAHGVWFIPFGRHERPPANFWDMKEAPKTVISSGNSRSIVGR
jgi:hypothetical protein